ncbi:MAG: TetR/AcrR family transcriptional regulator [Alphaproteobacteria bacterium]|nr:TetR/AcrR family transcriptional regulator [Alphaproteobacteria bacterium]
MNCCRKLQMVRKTKEDTEQTRMAIMESALQTFYDKGFSRTTFDEIAKRINLTKGAVYWHFRNKADIIAAIIKERIPQNSTDISKILTVDELKSSIIKRAENIEKDKKVKDFLFFMLYRMEWSEAVLDNVWAQIGDLCELSDKNLYDILCNLQKNGQIKKDANITILSEILICFMRGCINKYVSGIRNNTNLTTIVAEGFDTIINNVRAENK